MSRRPILSRHRVLSLVLAGALFATLAEARKPSTPEDLFNPLLGPEYAHWLVGPIVEMASEDEVERFLALTVDEDAAAFIANFWQARNAGTKVFTKTPQQVFEQRASEADKRYTEGTYPGRRTDRGTTLILYGEPEKIVFESPTKVDDPPLEVWRYAKGSERGLDGEKPKKQYRFVDLGTKVVRYTGQNLPPDFKQRLRRRN